MGRGEMGLMCDGGFLGLGVCAVWVIFDCACSRGGLPAQVLVEQPDQHHRERGVYRTDGAYFTVRRGAVWLRLSLGLAAWLLHGWGAFFGGLI